MRRRLANFLTAWSLVLCVATGLLWAVTGRRTYFLRYASTPDANFAQTSQFLLSDYGKIAYEWVRREGRSCPADWSVGHVGFAAFGPYWRRDESPPIQAFGGYGVGSRFGYRDVVFNSGAQNAFPWRWHESAVWVPHWFLVVIFAVLPARWLLRRSRQWRRERRASRGQCVLCGYDLTGNESGRCPECGGARSALVPPPRNPPMQRTATAGTAQ